MRTCCPIWCGGCWRMAPIPASCICCWMIATPEQVAVDPIALVEARRRPHPRMPRPPRDVWRPRQQLGPDLSIRTEREKLRGAVAGFKPAPGTGLRWCRRSAPIMCWVMSPKRARLTSMPHSRAPGLRSPRWDKAAAPNAPAYWTPWPTRWKTIAMRWWRCARGSRQDLWRRHRRSARGGGLLPLLCAAGRKEFAAPEVLKGPVGETNALALHGRGVFACISPWNFPLAIFTGQIAAALAAGNTVIAKPAEQTPRIAAAAVRLFKAAGLDDDVLHPGAGRRRTVGAALVKHPVCAGVAFTGGTDTAGRINRLLADADGALVPFIAETGGLNAHVRGHQRPARAGDGRCDPVGLRLGRPALLGAAHAVPAAKKPPMP